HGSELNEAGGAVRGCPEDCSAERSRDVSADITDHVRETGCKPLRVGQFDSGRLLLVVPVGTASGGERRGCRDPCGQHEHGDQAREAFAHVVFVHLVCSSHCSLPRTRSRSADAFSSFRFACARWQSTVRSSRRTTAAISGLLRPWATSKTIRSSVCDSSGTGTTLLSLLRS